MLAGIDTHKDMLAVGIIDTAGRVIVTTHVANTEVWWCATRLHVRAYSGLMVST